MIDMTIKSVPVDPPAHDEQTRWQAVLERDARQDGAFVYAVRSTGVYCRPTCPARRPRREQVAFFDDAEAAEQAGFRACRRCQPHATHAPAVEIAQHACRYMDARPGERVTLDELGRAVNLSPFHLQRTFRQVMGVTPRQYAGMHRLERLKAQLKEGQTVAVAGYEAGFGSSGRLYERAPDQLGMTPSVYRAGGTGVQIGYTTVECTLGRLLVAGTSRGVCMVSLGDGDAPLVAALASEYPKSVLAREDEALAPWARAILDHLAGQQEAPDVPVDAPGTAFQQRVWAALCAIPYGSTRTYKDIAVAIGDPNAVRAVGRACATNPVALVVPCHRAVRTDGGLGGYRWGIERKRRLLAQEQHADR